MRMSVSRGIGMSFAVAILGLLVACAPVSNPEPYPQKTAEATASPESVEATPASETAEAAPTSESAESATPSAEGTSAAGTETQATATPANENAESAASSSATTASATTATDAKDMTPVATDSDEAIAKAKAETRAVEKKDRTKATWEFTITDKAVVPTNPKPEIVDDVTFKVVNKSKKAYTFKLEGIKIAPVKVPAGKDVSFKGTRFGPGGIVISAICASPEDKNPKTMQTRIDIQPHK